jgi:hypothetical protein
MTIIIDTVSDTRFTYNGIEYFKNFTPIVRGDNIEVVNTYDRRISLTDSPTIYSDYIVDGVAFATVELLQTALLPVLFTRSTLSGGGGGSSDVLQRAVAVFAEATSVNNATIYSELNATKLSIPRNSDLAYETWLSGNGQTTNQVLNIYFEKGVTPEFLTYINGGTGVSTMKGGCKNTLIYGMTSQTKWNARSYTTVYTDPVADAFLLFDATGTTGTDGTSGSGVLNSYSYTQNFGRGEELQILPNSPLIYGLVLRIADRYNENYISIKRIWLHYNQ